jgi:hypothetical protein
MNDSQLGSLRGGGLTPINRRGKKINPKEREVDAKVLLLVFEQGFERARDPLNHTNEHEMSLVSFREF